MDSRHRGNSFLAPEEIPHLAAIEKLESEFIYKMTYSWLLCACHKRLNNNSFHVHHTGFPSANSPKKSSYMADWWFLHRVGWQSITAQCLIKQRQVNAATLSCQCFVSDSLYWLLYMETYNKIMIIRFCWIWSDIQLIKSHLDFIKKMTEKLFPMWVLKSVRAVRVVFEGV